MKKPSHIWDFHTSKEPMESTASAFGSGSETARQAHPEPLAEKERNVAEQGQKRTGGMGSFPLMRNVRWTHGAAGMALGAVAVWLGKENGNGPGLLIPASLALMVVFAMLGWESLGFRRRGWGRFGLASFAPAGSASAIPPSSDGAAQAEAGGAALLSHEMKNYLCTLKGNAHLLRQRVPSDSQAIIDRIDRVVEKLESFTCLLGAGAGATSLGALAPTSPAQAAQACVRTHFHKRIEAFRFSEDPAAPSLLCDPGRLDQVFLNLYANALEAGAVHIGTEVRREGGRLVLRIEDDGRGCAEEDLARIFEPFFTTKSGPARRGLGMFIVQSIVENHGGSVRVATKNNGADGRTGLIFTLDFPQPGRGAVSARPAPLTPAQASPSKEWMLGPPAVLL